MARITNRQEFKTYCLQQLGEPLVQVNIDETQIENRVDQAIEYYRLYHYDGIERVYLKHQLTQLEVDQRFIELPEVIYGVSKVFPFVGASQSGNIFDLQYQLRLNDLYDLTATSVLYYVNVMSYLDMLDLLLNGHKQIRFNRLSGKLYLDEKLSQHIEAGKYIIVDCYRVMDPETNTLMYNDLWFRDYTTLLIKLQWAINLKKFSGLQLPGAVTLNGKEMYDEAMAEKKQMEDDMMTKGAPLDWFMG